MSDIKISVIIPIYNCEKYLKKCLNSVQRQTMKKIEIICVDDGSTDSSAKLIKEIASRDKRVYLLQQKNQGPGPAKNSALMVAKGKYVTFLDADDYYLDVDALYKMFQICEEKKISICASMRKNLVDGNEEPGDLFYKTNKNVILDYIDFQQDYDYQNYLFLKEFLLNNDFFFPQYRRYEDPVFLTKVLFAARKFIVVDTYLYCYRQPIMSTRFNSEKTIDLLNGLADNLNFAIENHLKILFEKTLHRLEYEYFFIILNNFALNDIRLLDILLKINQMVCDHIGIENYIIRPLKGVLLYLNEYEKKLLLKIQKSNGIVLYGAGYFGQIFLKFLKIIHLYNKVEGFVVSDGQKSSDLINGIPVTTLHEIQKEKFVLVTVGQEIQKEIEDYLNINNYTNYETVHELFLSMVEEEMKRRYP